MTAVLPGTSWGRSATTRRTGRAKNASATYAFTHALIRATLYDELSTPRRVQPHRRIAESLESLYAASIDDHLGERAVHYSVHR